MSAAPSTLIADAIRLAKGTGNPAHTRMALAQEVIDRHGQLVAAQAIDARQGNEAHEGFASEVPIFDACERFIDFVDPDGECGIDFEDIDAVVALARTVL